METSTKFSTTELVLVTSNSVISKLFLVYPAAFATLGGSASILLSIMTVIAGFILTMVFVRLYNNRENSFLITGKKSAKICLWVVFILLFTVNQAYFVRSIVESLKISILPDSPIFFIAVIFMSCVLISSITGLKSIIRAHSFIVPFTIIMTVILSLSSIGNIDFYNIFPLFGNGPSMFIYLILLTSYFEDFIVLLFIIPYASERTSFKKVIIPSYVISSIMLIIIISLYTLVIPYSVSDSFFIPVYRVAQYVSYKSFMARMESIFTIAWILSCFLNSAIYLYITAMLSGRIFNAKTSRPYMYVLSTIILMLSFIPDNTSELVKFSDFYAYPRFILGILLPIIILYISRKKGSEL